MRDRKSILISIFNQHYQCLNLTNVLNQSKTSNELFLDFLVKILILNVNLTLAHVY